MKNVAVDWYDMGSGWGSEYVKTTFYETMEEAEAAVEEYWDNAKDFIVPTIPRYVEQDK